MYVRNKKMKDRNQYYIIEDKIKVGDKYKTKNIRYLGTAKKLLKDLEELDKIREKS